MTSYQVEKIKSQNKTKQSQIKLFYLFNPNEQGYTGVKDKKANTHITLDTTNVRTDILLKNADGKMRRCHKNDFTLFFA